MVVAKQKRWRREWPASFRRCFPATNCAAPSGRAHRHMTIILGLNAFRADSSGVIVRDGKLIAAAEEERFCRIKHWAGFPTHAIAYCLREAGVELSDVDHVAFNQDSRANV